METIKVAVIGPQDLVETVLSLSHEFPSLSLQAYPYISEKEAPTVFERASSDIYVFTGPIPYHLVKEAFHPPQPLIYVPLTGSGLIRALCQVLQKDREDLQSLSIDTIKRNAILDVLEDVDLHEVEVYSKEFSHAIAAGELVTFHSDLYGLGKTSVALTCLHSTYERLLSLKIPCYRVLPTRSDIRETLRLTMVQGEELSSKESQVAIQICEIDDFEKLLSQSSSEYEVERTRLTLQQILNNYAEWTWSSLYSTGVNRFTMFTTRGILEKCTNYFQNDPLLIQIREQLSTKINIGIGLGRTAYHAELNARQALERAKKAGSDCSYALTDSGNLIGPLGVESPLTSTIVKRHLEFTPLTENVRLSVETITRVASLIDMVGKDTITAVELAQGLKISRRNARRILNRMLEGKLAEIYGEEQPIPSGEASQAI